MAGEIALRIRASQVARLLNKLTGLEDVAVDDEEELRRTLETVVRLVKTVRTVRAREGCHDLEEVTLDHCLRLPFPRPVTKIAGEGGGAEGLYKVKFARSPFADVNEFVSAVKRLQDLLA